MSDVDDALAKMRAASDQWRESSREIAGNVATYHTELIENGVDPGDATELTLGYQGFLLATIFGVFGPLTEPEPEDE